MIDYTLTVRGILNAPMEFLGKNITLNGWVRTSRDVKACAFVELNDGSTVKNIQIVVDAENPMYNQAASLSVGSAISVTGEVISSPNPKQPVEIKCHSFSLEGDCPSDYPLQKKRHSIEFLRSIQHLRPRTNLFSSAFRIRSEVAFAIHSFFHEKGFVYAHTPIFTASDAEGAGAMFQATTLLEQEKLPLNKDGKIDFSQDFFGKEMFLTVTGQLEAEVFALAYKNTYTFGPTFRAEHSTTARHAAEFWMIEPEIAFADLVDNMDLAEEMTKYVINYVLKTCTHELEFLDAFVSPGLIGRLQEVAQNQEFGRITYTEAIGLLEKNKANFEFPVFWGCDLQTEHEKYISETVFKKPTFITDYPKEIKAFYMRRNDDGKTVAACDMVVPGIGELVGGSQREERLDILEQSIAENGLKRENYWWYIELRKFGGVKHSGYGIGFERLLMYITGISNIRDVLPFPRTFGGTGL